jgi:hypothetical protein
MSLTALDIHVWVYKWEGRSAQANKILQSEQENRSDSKLDCCEGESLRSGAYVLDFDLKRDSTKFMGIFRVVDNEPMVGRGGIEILLCHKVPTIPGLDLGNVKIWESAASKAAKCEPKHEKWELFTFYEKYLGS